MAGTQLSPSFTVESHEQWVVAHNQQVREVVAAYKADRPIRVPLLSNEWYGQHGYYADEIGLDYRDYYSNPELMLRVQLEAARRRRELPICDMVLGEAPESWPVSVDQWPVPVTSWVGCPTSFRPDSVPAHKPLHLSREQADAMPMPDPLSAGLLKTIRQYWDTIRHLTDGLTFLGQSVGPVGHGVAAYGVFALALAIRGEDIMVDMLENPAFAHRFLHKLAGWIVEFESTWDRLAGGDGHVPCSMSDHGIEMLSPRLYEEFLVPIIQEMSQRHGTEIPGRLHHCGTGPHLFPVIKRHFGLKGINALTYPLVDIAKVRQDLGDEVWIEVIIFDPIVQLGPEEAIRDAVRDVMKAKGQGRFALMFGDMLRGTPLVHYQALYEAVKEFGQYR